MGRGWVVINTHAVYHNEPTNRAGRLMVKFEVSSSTNASLPLCHRPASHRSLPPSVRLSSVLPPPCPSHPTRTHSGPSLFSGRRPGGERGRGLCHSGGAALHGSSPGQPVPSGPAGRLRPLLPVCHVGAVCHICAPGAARLTPSEPRAISPSCTQRA